MENRIKELEIALRVIWSMVENTQPCEEEFFDNLKLPEHKEESEAIINKLIDERERENEEQETIILSARITKIPENILEKIPEVYVKTDKNPSEEIFLFSYYPDEIQFSEKEFVGLTIAKAKELKHKKDVAYIMGRDV
jgi:hypothetical protein